MQSTARPTSRISGFSLIAAAIGLTVAALVMVSLLPGKEVGGFNRKAATSISRLGVVEQAMIGFMAKNGRLPCPADGQYDVNAATGNFGVEAASPGTCKGGTPAAPLGPDAGTTFVVGGVIPTKTLALDDSYAFDEWGHRFTYVVDKRATLNTSCATITTGGITIKNTTGGAVIANVMHAFIAHGPDGHGAWPMAGGAAPANRINTGSQDHDKWTNAGVNGSFTYSTANFTNVFIRKEATATFSDIVYYAEYTKNNCYVAVGITKKLTANQGGGTLANGSTLTEYVNSTDPTCTPYTLTNNNGTLSCSVGGANLANCAYLHCTPSGGGTCSPSANQGGGTIAVGGTRINEYTNLSDGTCASHTLTCNAGTPNTLSCSVGGADLTACTYNSCVQTCSLSANQGGGTLPGSGSNTKTEYTSLSDGTCTAHTLTCTGTATTNALSCSVGGADLTACAYSSCGLDCGLTGGQGGGVMLNGATPLTEYVSANDATCTAYTMSCTNGTLSCSSGGMGNCVQNSCNRTCALTANQNGGSIGTLNSTATKNPEYKALTDATCTANTLTCTNGTLSCNTGTLSDCSYNPTCTVVPAPTLSGTRIDGATANDGAGESLATGDVNGDGIRDLIIGAWPASYNSHASSGSVYVVFGKASGAFPDPLPLSTLNGANGFRLDGATATDYTGFAVAAGDINGDGYADILIGAENAGYNSVANSGSVYAVYGGPAMKNGTAWSTCPCLLTSAGSVINGTNGFRLDGVTTSDNAGHSVAVADVNGDGLADILIDNGASIYVVYGGASGKMLDGTAWAATQLLSAAKPINGTDGFRLDISSLTHQIATGDINGDGIADILIGAPNNGYNGVANSGSVYAVYGPVSMSVATTVSTTNRSTTATVASGTGLAMGQTVVSANIPAGTTISTINNGTTLTLSAKATATASGTPLTVNLSSRSLDDATFINGTNGFRLDGDTTWYLTGSSVAAGDINGDGKADIIIGANQAGYNSKANSGSVYVVYGGATGKMLDGTAWAAAQLLTAAAKPIDGTNGFRLDGATAGDQTGWSVATGDINRDGYADIIIGAEAALYIGTNSGSAYVVYGGASGRMKDGTAWAATNLLTAASKPIDGSNGFRLDSATAWDITGSSVAVGDINGDGYPDIFIGADAASYGGGAGRQGSVYVVNGQSCPFAATNSLGNVVSAPAVCSPNAPVHNIWVADVGHNRVQEFASNGIYQSQFGSAGSGNGQFYSSSPYGIAIDGSGNIWVVDYGNSRVEKFNSSGVYQSQFGSTGAGNGQFIYPYGIAIDGSGNLWVADTYNSRVQKFNSSGVYQSQFGSTGTGNGQFNSPEGIAIDGSGNIWVADNGNNRVQEFNSSGAYVSQFGTSGSGNGQFTTPSGIAIDGSGNIWVVDHGNNRVEKFNSSGAYVSQFGTVGSGNGQFAIPSGIAIDGSGNIWVTDSGNNRVQKFNSSGVYQSQFGSAGTGNGHFNGPQGIAIY
jgi:DNA-binding beta-propeller fold protein YncE